MIMLIGLLAIHLVALGIAIIGILNELGRIENRLTELEKHEL